MTILPSNKLLDEYFDDYFVLYKPKDVVSGDFYWFAKTIDRVFIAVVDCTGHGVPGAFMSLIGYNLLNTIVLRQNILEPGKILSELHRQVRHALKQDQDGSKSKDGMDVALLSIELYQNKFYFAGAFRPLFFVHRGEFTTIDGDKMSIGGEQLEEERNFSTHTFEYEPGDLVYIFS
ncbi:MAG: SpoIIE family protein phosphatase, partial [Bacteroidia bacterium]|nr:SpoIIE family protein phosphatase [Bacteroidia bacterium]